MKRETMHALFMKLKGTCRYITELQNSWLKWDHDLCDTRSEVYLQVTRNALVWSHGLVKKMQSADWSTKEAGDEGPSSLCQGVFTPVLRDQQAAIM